MCFDARDFVSEHHTGVVDLGGVGAQRESRAEHRQLGDGDTGGEQRIPFGRVGREAPHT